VGGGRAGQHAEVVSRARAAAEQGGAQARPRGRPVAAAAAPAPTSRRCSWLPGRAGAAPPPAG
jgi:hypothetical protein